MVDTIDLKIIAQLEINARALYVDIGNIGLSPSFGTERIQEDNEIITGYKLSTISKTGLWSRGFLMFKLFGYLFASE
jgi:Lrp/AsnC family leucine-responsive transcriptional regulator